jgi:hypothetical protein
MYYHKKDICPIDDLLIVNEERNYIYTQTIFQMQFLNHIFSKLHFLRTGDEIIDTIVLTIFQWLFITIITSISYFIGILLSNIIKYFYRKIINVKITYKNFCSKNCYIEISSILDNGKYNILFNAIYYYLTTNIDYKNELNLEYFILDKNKILIQKKIPFDKSKEFIYNNTIINYKITKEIINKSNNIILYKIILSFTKNDLIIIDNFCNFCLDDYKNNYKS